MVASKNTKSKFSIEENEKKAQFISSQQSFVLFSLDLTTHFDIFKHFQILQSTGS